MDEKPDYHAFLKSLWDSGELKNAPHCDSRVLHEPEKCHYCALEDFKPLHEFRLRHGISYTGGDPKLWLCPAEEARSKQVIDMWHGNRSMTLEQIEHETAEHRRVMKMYFEMHDDDGEPK